MLLTYARRLLQENLQRLWEDVLLFLQEAEDQENSFAFAHILHRGTLAAKSPLDGPEQDVQVLRNNDAYWPMQPNCVSVKSVDGVC